jgi:hypothetical protein
MAQKMLQSYDLGAEGFPALQLVVNWTPCTMCFGALIWSGCTSLFIAGHGKEVEEITGFDEGPIPGGPGIHAEEGIPNWQVELKKRGIEVMFGTEVSGLLFTPLWSCPPHLHEYGFVCRSFFLWVSSEA